MKHLELTILAVAICCVGPIIAEVNICSNVTDGVFLANLYNCSDYWVCWGQVAYPGSCPSNHFFSAKTQRCDLAAQTECVQQCNGTLTTFPYDKTCTKYILCFDGTPVVQECLDNLQFNADTDRCDYPQNVDCQANMCTGVNDPDNIVRLPSHSSCSKYYICYNGAAVPQECSAGLVFNPVQQGCDYKSNTQCTIPPKTRTVLPYAKMPPSRAKISCPKEGSHFYPNESDSSTYYFCLNGNGVVLTCSPGLVYDKVMESCRDPNNVKN